MRDLDRRVTVAMVMANTLYRQGLSMLLESGGDIAVAAQAESCESAADALGRVSPDVVIIELPSADVAVDAIEMVVCATAAPGSRVIVLGEFRDAGPILRLFDAGVKGYILKENQAEILIDAVRAIARDEYVVDTNVIGALLDEMRQMRSKIDSCCPGTRQSVLTSRQQELLQLVAEGHTNRHIADLLGISESTVKNHLHQVFAKLGVASRSQAIGVGVRLGIVRP